MTATAEENHAIEDNGVQLSVTSSPPPSLDGEEFHDEPMTSLSTPLLRDGPRETYPSSSPLMASSRSLAASSSDPPPDDSLAPTKTHPSSEERGGHDCIRHILTIISGTLAVMHAMFVLGSYFGAPWSDTMVQFDVRGGDMPFWSRVEGAIGSVNAYPATLHTNLQLFKSSGSYGMLLLIVFTTIILPCSILPFHPLLVFGSHRHTSGVSINSDGNKRNRFLWWDRAVGRINSRFAHRLHSVLLCILTILEVVTKCAMGVIFVNALLGIATSVSFALGTEDSGVRIVVSNVIRGGLASYLVGVTAGIWMLGFVRYQLERHESGAGGNEFGFGGGAPRDMNVASSTLFVMDDEAHHAVEKEEEVSAKKTKRSKKKTKKKSAGPTPPQSAFLFTWHKGNGAPTVNERGEERLSSASGSSDETEQSGASPPAENRTDREIGSLATALSYLEHEPNPDGNGAVGGDPGRARSNSTPMGLETAPSESSMGSTVQTPNQAGSVYRQIVLYECAVLAPLLLLPVYTLPLIRLEYEGLGADFMNETTVDLTLWQIAGRIWSNGHESATMKYIVLLTSALFNLNVILLPLVSLIVVLLLRLTRLDWIWWKMARHCHWTRRQARKRRMAVRNGCRRFLMYVYPNANGTVFALTIFATAQCLKQVSEYLFDRYGICDKMVETLGEQCLVITGTALGGAVCAVLQGLALDILVHWTLREFRR